MRSGAERLERDVVAVMGLPFDVVGLAGAWERLRSAGLERRPCLLSTPNINNLVACRSDAAYRHSVLVSDISLADGAPVIWVARALGLPLRERVPGSSLFEHAMHDARAPLDVYFFGGPEGAAAAAHARFRDATRGLRAVGGSSPGFGSIEAMSNEATLAPIRASRAHWLIVALSTAKGMAWLLRNRDQLDVPVLAHLGAVVNFAAGTVQRAPRWAQVLQIEWLWRIKEEPALWRRYWNDGRVFLRMLATEVLPLALSLRLSRRIGTPPTLDDAGDRLALAGAWAREHTPRLRTALAARAKRGETPAIDLARVEALDPTTLATLMLWHGWCAEQGQPARWVGATPALRNTLARSGARWLLGEQVPAP